MGVFGEVLYAVAHTLRDHALDILNAALGSEVQRSLHSAISPKPQDSRWAIARAIRPILAVDGAVLEGPAPANAYAKYAIPKGLPSGETKRSLAIENDPHKVDDFDGVIEQGYGKGTKRLLASDTAIVKVAGRTFPGKFNYHFHDADVAGPHYDLVVEGLPPGTRKWELHIPRGPYKGRYAFNDTSQGLIIVPMKDRGLVVPKPDYRLKDESFLRDVVAKDPGGWIVEQKLDGSLGNAVIHENRAMFRSHRDTGETYYDRLPQLEHLSNHSSFWMCRKLFPGPDQNGTVLTGELYHPDGAARVGGILNAYPHKAREIQDLRGAVSFYAWDTSKIRGHSVAHLDYAERRRLLEDVISEIHLFNKYWGIVPKSTGDPHAFYQQVIQKPLPFGEGVVCKKAGEGQGDTWFKVKQVDFVDLEVIDILEGEGKYAQSVGRLLVRDPETGGQGEVGSFAITDEQRQWIWDHKEQLLRDSEVLRRPISEPGRSGYVRGPRLIAKVRVQEMTASGAPRAGVFMAFHEGKGSEAGLYMYAESLAGGDPKETQSTKYKLISSAGWKR
jgi:hypothetical protein